jgi:ABC-type branched-subunit amino acid transport system substrate-binding protein
VIKAVREANLTIGVTIFGGDSLMDGTVPALIGAAAAAGVRGSEVAPGSPEFQAAFQEFTAGRNISFVAKAAHAYDAAVALMEAFARAEEPKTGPQIAAALSKVKFAGESGPIEFDESGDLKFDQSNSTAYYTILEYFPDGSMGPEAKESWRP